MAKQEKKLEEMTFEEKVDEWIRQEKALYGEEVMEAGAIPGREPPFPSFVADEKCIRDFAHSVGDENPLFIDPAYSAKTKYGCILAPPVILMAARYTVNHGPPDFGARLFAPMFSGTLFEWYDVIPVGTRFWTSLRFRELVEKKGTRGRLLIANSEGFYWNQRGELLGKARGHEIFIPMPSVAGTDSSRIGEQMLYEREIQKYTEEEIAKIKKDLDSEERRGAEPRYWEDINIGDALPTSVMGPYHGQDQTAHRSDSERLGTWELNYKAMRESGEKYVHPLSKWPWTEGGRVEHEDPILCRYRGIPGPFDYGAQRVDYGGRYMTDWIGDEGFLRRFYLDLRKFKYYGDTTRFTGTVTNKYKVKEKGEAGLGGAPGEVEYAAVDIEINATNQVGEKTIMSRATAYLPSRELGPVKLPIPHLPRPPRIYREAPPEYVPFPRYVKEEPVVSMAGKFADRK